MTQNYVGIDCHEKQNTIALFRIEQDKVTQQMLTTRHPIGTIPNDEAKLRRKLEKIEQHFGTITMIGYEAGFSGYNLYRRLHSWGYKSCVLAPSTIPKKPGSNKYDPVDAGGISQVLFTKTATVLRVPTEDQERGRALVRRQIQVTRKVRKVKIQITHFMKIHNISYTLTKERWTKTFYKWLYSYQHEDDRIQILLEDMIEELHLYESQKSRYNEHIFKMSEKVEYQKVRRKILCFTHVPFSHLFKVVDCKIM